VFPRAFLLRFHSSSGLRERNKVGDLGSLGFQHAGTLEQHAGLEGLGLDLKAVLLDLRVHLSPFGSEGDGVPRPLGDDVAMHAGHLRLVVRLEREEAGPLLVCSLFGTGEAEPFCAGVGHPPVDEAERDDGERSAGEGHAC